MADKREIHITAYGNKIDLDAHSDDCGIDAGDVLNILCKTIAGIYLKVGKEDTKKEEFADAVRNGILRILTTEVKEMRDVT